MRKTISIPLLAALLLGVAIGPAVSWAASRNFFLGLKTQWESSAENRPEGNRTTFRMTYKF